MRNIDTIIRDTLGNQAVQIIQLQARNEALEVALQQAREAVDAGEDEASGPVPAQPEKD